MKKLPTKREFQSIQGYSIGSTHVPHTQSPTLNDTLEPGLFPASTRELVVAGMTSVVFISSVNFLIPKDRTLPLRAKHPILHTNLNKKQGHGFTSHV